MTEKLKDNSLPASSFDGEEIGNDIQAKKQRLLEIEKEQNELNKDLGGILEKIANVKTKMADKIEFLSEEAFINLAVKNKIYADLLNKAEKLKLSGESHLEELKETERKLSEAEKEKIEAKQKSDALSKGAEKFRKVANTALNKAQKHSEIKAENL
jgi:hypothetical protein